MSQVGQRNLKHPPSAPLLAQSPHHLHLLEEQYKPRLLLYIQSSCSLIRCIQTHTHTPTHNQRLSLPEQDTILAGGMRAIGIGSEKELSRRSEREIYLYIYKSQIASDQINPLIDSLSPSRKSAATSGTCMKRNKTCCTYELTPSSKPTTLT